MKIRTPLCLVLGLLLLGAPVSAQELDVKQREADAVRNAIAEQGRRLSMADEDYNEARLRRGLLERELAEVDTEAAEAEDRWRSSRDRLGARVRSLYMYPGAAIDAFLGIESFADAGRAATLSTSVMLADGELIDRTAQTRAELEERMEALAVTRAELRSNEEDLATKRVALEAEMDRQQALLRSVEGEIAEIMEAERQRELEEARRAAEEAARAAAEEAARAAAEAAQAEQPTEGSPAEVVGGEDEPAPAPVPAPGGGEGVRPAAAKALATARAQIGKPYEWAGEGPDSYDCSGLTMYAWASAGVSLPHSSRAQYASLPRVARSKIQPGDLLFFGNPIHHVGIYEGKGVMINASETGVPVRRDSIRRSDYVGAGRPG